jgi:hypothetical protein
MRAARRHVRFTPESGHVRCNGPYQLWAKSGHCNAAFSRSLRNILKILRRRSTRTG